MLKFFLILVLSCSITRVCIAQAEETTEDSLITGTLGEVVVRAYEQNKRLQDVPAAVSYIGRTSLNRFNNTNILPALNTTPGVRMEERSPGSYRLNIRGSSLRAPFGVRNVKIYYNNIPLTDPGGHTYLNQLGFYNFQSIEIIKGPGSSLYGSGTGGVMLIESSAAKSKNGFSVDYSAGSFNLQNISGAVRFGTDEARSNISFQHQISDGYRAHSQMRRDMFSWNTAFKLNDKNELTTSFLYGDLYYQTPGPLTLNEYTTTPTAARPRAGFLPGSAEVGAAIFQKTFLAGATNKYVFNDQWQNSSTFYGAFTQLKNPTIRNYGRSSEPHFGGRTIFQFQKTFAPSILTWHVGAELQQGFTALRIYNIRAGNPDSLQTDDELNNRQAFVFTQLSFQGNGWTFTGGASLNQLAVRATRLSALPVTERTRKYNNELAPRIAVLKKLTNNINVYGSIAKGFSPPTSAEVLPSSGIVSTDLNAEDGINYELGTKGAALKGSFYFEVNAFLFNLKNTIVQRRDATGGDFFINAGSTDQKGLETQFNYQALGSSTSFFNPPRISFSHTWNNFRYKEFKQVTNDFSGNRLPSAAPHTVFAGLDVTTRPGLYLNLSYFYSDPIPLNDANTELANSYNLLGSRVGFRKITAKGFRFELFAGADNLFDVRYSLGNDINGFGGRYYNTAPRRNYYAGISLSSSAREKRP